MKKAINLLIILLLSSYLVTNSIITSYSIESKNVVSSTGYIPDSYERIIESENNERGLNYPSVPSSFDPRLYNYDTPEKSQGLTTLCWMFATTAGIEQYLSKNYGEKVALSEAHGARALSEDIIPENQIDESGYYTNELNVYGNTNRALQYYTNWNAPIGMANWNSAVTDESYPFSKVYDEIDNDFYEKDSFSNVMSTKFVSTNNRLEMQDAIYNYGGVTISIPGNLSYTTDINGDTVGSNIPHYDKNNHTVLLVGWDDDYPKENFTNQPNYDGAWLVKNSNGEGYHWYSYYNTYATNSYGTVITGVKKADPNEKMLSYDYLIPNHKSYNYNSGAYLCNVFDVSDYTDTYDRITKVMTYFTIVKNCEYEVRIIQLNSNGELPTNNIDNYDVLASGMYSGEGYLTIDLDTPFYFSSNNKCAIIIKLIPSTDSSRIYIPYEDRLLYSNVFENIFFDSIQKINANESFYAIPNNNGQLTWNDCYTDNNYGCDSRKGNLIIRPVLYKESPQYDTISLSPNQIADNNQDVPISISSPEKLFNIHTANNQLLVENVDYYRSNNGIIIKNSYIKSLNGTYSELVLEFIGSSSKTIGINSKSDITDVSVSGNPIVGETIYANVTGYPERSSYDLDYQWQYSYDGLTWYNISGATYDDYVIDNSYFNCYFRVTVTPQTSGNVNSGNTSNSTAEKSVILGDVNLDSYITIGDAYLVQLYVAQMQNLSNRQKLAADYNMDGVINETDATLIQLKVAELLKIQGESI